MSEKKHSESSSGQARHSHSVPAASFPTHNSPRTWFLTSSLTPLVVRLIRQLLSHGDYVVACLPPSEIDHEERGAEFRELVNECKSSRKDREGWKDRIRAIRCDGRIMSQCGAAVAEAKQHFGRIDILLCCTSEAIVGTVEELSTTPATQNLVHDQFESIFFSQVNFIKASLPTLRAQHTGHIIILSSIGGHIGTPGMAIHTAATWALEGFCDSLAYEVAPFNIKVTIVQPHKEIQSLTNKIVFSPPLPHYDSESNPAPSVRDMLTNVLNMNPETAIEPSDTEILYRYPKLPSSSMDRLVAETIHALTAIGGHENPPARHIVGFEGAEAVKEKLKTVTEELEDFVEASPGAHINVRMSLDSMLPVASARVRALTLPIGQIKQDRFSSFLERLNQEHVVQLRDITPDPRPNRNMFSPLAFPDGVIFYDTITYVPPPSHLALSPFELFREPMALIAIADGKELGNVAFNKRQSTMGPAPTLMERNIRTLYQGLEELRDAYPKMLTHHILIFDYSPPADHEIPAPPEGIKTIPPLEQSIRTTIKTIMCDITSLLLAEMTTLAKSFEAMTVIDTPGQTPMRPGLNGTGSWASDDANPAARRNSQFALSSMTRSASTSGAADRSHARMSMPVAFKSLPFGSNSSTPTARPTTPVRSGLSNPPTTFDDITQTNGDSPDVVSPNHKTPTRNDIVEGLKDKVSVQGFGPGGLNERWRNKGKGRVLILVGSLYLQAGRWPDALKELSEGATVAKSINDHLWHGKALELITTCLILLGWAGLEFQVPSVCHTNEKNTMTKALEAELADPNQPKHLRNLQVILPDLLEKIIGLFSRISGEQLPPLPFSEAVIRFCNTLTALHLCEGKINKQSLEVMVFGRFPPKKLTTSPRLSVEPPRGQINNMLFKAFPSSAPELLTTADRAIILGGIAAVLGILGYHRKKALVVRELVSVLIGGLVEARTRGAAEVGIHPAAGLVALNAVNGHGNGAGALELGEGDIEHGIDAFLGLLCKTYGVVSFEDPSISSTPSNDTDERCVSRIHNQSSIRQFGFQNIKLNILRACINFSEALPDFNGVLKFSSDLLRTAGSGVAPGPRREDAAPIITRDEQVRLATNISKTSSLSQRLGLGHLAAEYWDEFLIRGITLDPLPSTRTPIAHSKNDVNPFIYNPFLRPTSKADVPRTLVVGEAATFRVTLQNPFEIDGAEFESSANATVIGPYRTQILKVIGTPKSSGPLKITGAIVKVRGCRERRFPIFPQPWAPDTEIKIKGIGLAALTKSKRLPPPGPLLKPDDIELSVIPAQPSSVMILEGERQVFSVTLHNLSTTTAADLLLFSFQDSTQGPLQTALSNRDATPAELYEYEWVLAKKQALRHRAMDDAKRYIPPGGTATFEFEILGKPGLTSGTIQIDYAHLGVPQSEVTSEFHTRQVCLDLTVTVNASVELARMDVLPVQGEVPKSLWSRLGADTEPPSSDEYCLLLMDLRNAWPSDIKVRLEGERGTAIEEHILPGNTNRVLFPVPRIYLEDPHASVPALNPSRQRQFVVSRGNITPDIERANREAFWYREKILQTLSGTWTTLSGPARQGSIELRSIRLTARMIDVIKIDEVGIDVSVENWQPDTEAEGKAPAPKDGSVYVDEFVQIRVRVANRTDEPIYPTVRVMPYLCHRPLNVALDFTRKLAWNGTLQRALTDPVEPHSSTELIIGATPLCRGEFEFSASVEETQLWNPPPPLLPPPASESSYSSPRADKNQNRASRPRTDTEIMMDAVLGARERRIWHSRRPCLVRVRDRDGE
ncbi:transport protein Trs120 or TRAPPC9 TRAPP II complex subunit-domain-containing protein [Camillea tinctor]|nr:transport protein Trs120 or TRAPPC9 TRAPP II complex subunit-domain-containing protein [Camillea tinctor]